MFDKNASLVYVSSFIQAWENVVHNIAHAEFFNKCIIIERINVFNSFDVFAPITPDFATTWSKKKTSILDQLSKDVTFDYLEQVLSFFPLFQITLHCCKIKPWRRWKNRLEFPILPTINFSLETFSDPFCYPTEWTWGGGQNGEFHLKDLHLDTHHHQSSAHF